MSLKTITQCDVCGEKNAQTYYTAPKNICRVCYLKAKKIRADALKQKAIDYLGGKCKICEYKDCISAMDFHHTDPSTKEFMWIDMQQKEWDEITSELDKCDLLCCRCHREIHHVGIEDVSNSEYIPQIIRNQQRNIKTKCNYCDKEFEHSKNRSRKYCSLECRNLYQKQQIIEKSQKDYPSKEELQELINSIPWVSIGKIYGVSDNCVKKWAKKFGIVRNPDAKIKYKQHNSIYLLQEDGTKICPKCSRKMLEQDFQKYKSQKDGLVSHCRGCSELTRRTRLHNKKDNR